MKRTLIALAASGMVACGGNGGGDGGGGGSDALCDLVLGGGNASAEGSTEPGCLACSTSDEANAIDGSRNTFAAMSYPPGGSGTQTITGTAQSGVVFPAGSNAAAYISFQDALSGTINVRLLMDGEVVSQSSTTCQLCREGNTTAGFYGVSADEPFNGMQVEITDTQTGRSREMRIIELCPDHS